MNEKTLEARQKLGTDFRDTHGEQCKPPSFGLATKRFRAIDLSCRACDACGAGAGCWAWIPGRGTFGVEPPTSDSLGWILLSKRWSWLINGGRIIKNIINVGPVHGWEEGGGVY